MQRWIMGIIVILLFVSLPVVLFAIYGQYLVDYSLESIGLALESTESAASEKTIADHKLAEHMMKDLIVEEGAKGPLESGNLVLLESALRAYHDPEEFAGRVRSKIYLKEFAKNKSAFNDLKSQANKVLYDLHLFVSRHFRSFIVYVRRSFFQKFERTFQISDQMLLKDIDAREKAGDMGKAKELYRRYLRTYSDKPDWPSVALAFVNLLMNQKQLDEAENLLFKIERDYFATEQAKVAVHIHKKIAMMRKRMDDIQKLLVQNKSVQSKEEKDAIDMRLGLIYLSNMEFDEAKKYFEQVKDASNVAISQKAKFYLGWIQKLAGDLDKSVEILEALLSDENIEKEMQAVVEAQLADIYTEKGDIKRAKKYYDRLTDNLKSQKGERIVSMEAWLGVTEIEKGLVYSQLGEDPAGDEAFLEDAMGMAGNQIELQFLREKIQKVKSSNLRDEAFKKLRARQISEAQNLFEKYLAVHPKDGWTYSGLATCFLVLKDPAQAEDYAIQGLNYEEDEYTAAMLGYINLFLQKYEDAIGLFKLALSFNPTYVPAQYNLGFAYIKVEKYEDALETITKLYESLKKSRDRDFRAKILNNMGIALWGVGRNEEAIKTFRRALKLKPGFRDAQTNLDQVGVGERPGTMTMLDTTGSQEN